MYVVAGVTGNTGSIVARELLAQGEQVRVIVREERKGAAWRERGAQVAVADLGDAAALTRALTGAKGAYLLVPPNVGATDVLADRARVADALAKAVRDAGVPHVVMLSSVAAHRPRGTGPIVTVHDAEAKLRAATRGALTFLRAAYFMDNWGASVQAVTQQGVLPTFLPPGLPFAQVSTEDIGRTAARLLREPPAAGRVRVVELEGPEAASAEDVARAFAAATGKPVNVVALPATTAAQTLQGLGLGASMAGLYQEMFEGLASGVLAFEGGPGTVHVRGQVPLAEAVRALVAPRA